MSQPSYTPDTQWIEIAPGFAGYLALPPAGTGPGLVLWQEIFGVNAHIRAVAEQYALSGFVVLAPDVFWRQAPRVELGYGGDDWGRARTLMHGYSAPDMLADIGASVAALRARAEVGGAKVGSVGFCMGGKMAYLTAATTDIDAAVGYYGGGIQNQLDQAASIRCPILLHYGERDDHIPLKAVEEVKHVLVGKDAEVRVYKDAQHGFNCWARASYHAPSAALAQGRTTAFFAQHLHGAKG